MTEENCGIVKKLGGSSYNNSKKKKKTQQKKLVEEKKIIVRDQQIRVKIKHLEKELARIVKGDGVNKDKEKLWIEKKIAKLDLMDKKFLKKKNK